MKYDELAALAGKMSEAEVKDSIRALACDARFAAVVALLRNQREGFVVAGSQQNMAAHHGPLAHNQGSVFALDCVAGSLRILCDTPVKQRRKPDWQDTDGGE